jgi:lysophospholipase L1-like esterase
MKIPLIARIITVLAILALLFAALFTKTSIFKPSEPPTTVAPMSVNEVRAGMMVQSGTGCAPAPASTSRKIKIMGDSIMTPYGSSADAKSWPHRLKAQAATHGWEVTLHGIGGTMASEYLPGGPHNWVAQQVRDAQPDVVTLDFRANEHLNGQTPAQLKTNMLALIDYIRATSPNTEFLIVNPPVLWYHGFYVTVATQADYAAKMFEVAQERNTCWLDMTPFFSQTAPDPALPDDIHANDEGHVRYLVGIYTVLLQHCP